MKWCCDIFEGTSDDTSIRGLYVCVAPPNEYCSEPVYFIEFRSVNVEHEEQISAAIQNAPEIDDGVAGFAFRGRQAIHFCPWCGTALSDFYRDTWRSISEASPWENGEGDES